MHCMSLERCEALSRRKMGVIVCVALTGGELVDQEGILEVLQRHGPARDFKFSEVCTQTV